MIQVSSEGHVIFGTGPLGKAVMRELVRRGKSVRMVNRTGRMPVLPEGVEIISGDAYSQEFTAKVTQGAKVVYQCAQPPYGEWIDKFLPLQRSIVAGAARNGAKLVIGDNLYMYGEVNGPIHEDLPNKATTRKGKIRAQMTEELLREHREGKISVTIGRGSDFFGPEVLSSIMGERIFPDLIAGKAVMAVGNLDVPHTYTYIEDFGKALVTLGEREEALGEIWHVPNSETLTTRDFLTVAFELMGYKPKLKSMGRLMMAMGGMFIPEARETVEMMYQFEKPFIVDSSKYSRVFGEQGTFLTEAIQQTLTWYQGWGEVSSPLLY